MKHNSEQSIDSIQRDFIANISHELRTPLTVFRGYLEILLEDQTNGPLHEILTQMQEQTERMQVLVEDLLLLSRLESVELQNAQRIDVPVLLKEIQTDAIALSGDKRQHIQLHADVNLKIDGQIKELESAFANIVFNAVVYTPKDGVIDIFWREENDMAIFEVKDNGPGISPEHIPKLTQRFYRVDKARSREENSTGTGLGLAIVKHVMLRHQGELEINSVVGSGSTFRCVFPLHRLIGG